MKLSDLGSLATEAISIMTGIPIEEEVEVQRNENARLVDVTPYTPVTADIKVRLQDCAGPKVTTVGQYVNSEEFSRYGTPENRLNKLVHNYRYQGSGASNKALTTDESGSMIEVDIEEDGSIGDEGPVVAPLPEPEIVGDALQRIKGHARQV